jgi:serine/threonine protein kinase
LAINILEWVINKIFITDENTDQKETCFQLICKSKGDAVGFGKLSSERIKKIHDLLSDKEQVIMYLDYGTFDFEGEPRFILVYPMLFSAATTRQLHSPTAVRTVLREMVQSVGYLHEINYTHNDIKLNNFMISGDENFMVCN